MYMKSNEYVGRNITQSRIPDRTQTRTCRRKLSYVDHSAPCTQIASSLCPCQPQ